MPVYIECSSCHRKLRVRTELLGKSVRCPNCRAKFLATATEGPSAPPGEGGLTSAEAAVSTESAEAALAPPQPPEGAEESSGPTVRRPRLDVPPEMMVPLPPTEAIRVRPPALAAPPKSSATLAAVPAETPWEKVGLVVGLILLGVVLLGLAGAWWVHAGVRASAARPARRALLLVISRTPAPGRAQPCPAVAIRFRPCPSPARSGSSA